LNNVPRFFAYATGTLLIAAAIIVFSNQFISYTGRDDTLGLIALLAYGLVYLNLVFGVSRRFIRKLQEGKSTNIQYVFAALSLLPVLIWINVFDTGLGDSILLFHIVMIFACLLGGYFGHRSGLRQQEEFWNKVRDSYDGEELPDELKRPHDNLNKN